MAEVTERDIETSTSLRPKDWAPERHQSSGKFCWEMHPTDRGPWCGVCRSTYHVAEIVAAYRESCVAEERAARLKAEGERAEAVERADIAEAKWCGIEARLRATQTSRELAAEQGINILKVKLMAAEARLRDLVEAADLLLQAGDEMVARLESLEPHEVCCYSLEKACNAYLRARDAQASPEPPAERKYEWFRGEVDHDLLQKLVAQGILKPASPEPEASKRAGHAFHSGLDDTSTTCIHCGLPWSQHGGPTTDPDLDSSSKPARRRPTDSERLTWLLGGGLVGWGRRVAFFNIDRPTRRDFDRLMREEARAKNG